MWKVMKQVRKLPSGFGCYPCKERNSDPRAVHVALKSTKYAHSFRTEWNQWTRSPLRNAPSSFCSKRSHRMDIEKAHHSHVCSWGRSISLEQREGEKGERKRGRKWLNSCNFTVIPWDVLIHPHFQCSPENNDHELPHQCSTCPATLFLSHNLTQPLVLQIPFRSWGDILALQGSWRKSPKFSGNYDTIGINTMKCFERT